MIKRTIIFLLLFITLSSSVFAQNIEVHEDINSSDWCEEGELCDGSTSSVSMTVNGVENFEFEEYVWSDGDQIIIKFE